jgi:sugar (pentulose or hexulose) kinase
MTMTEARHVAVIDIGKTNAKLAIVDLVSLSEVAVRKTPNTVLTDGLYPHYDCDRLWAFVVAALREFQREFDIDAISVTTHGVAAALLSADGRLAMPVLDYEHDGPAALAQDYDAIRPPFSETGTPRLPVGLNLGAQIYWQAKTFPRQFGKVATIVTYPQYWAYLLSGVAANEATSLGCHTDLWNPSSGTYSSLVARMGWLEKMAPVRKAGDRLGPVLPDLAKDIGLKPDVAVYCGIHDSNASLYPHLLQRGSPFSVVSTGTWVIAMSVGGVLEKLDPARDCLVNVNALGDPVPSARFMGGREFSMLVEPSMEDCADADISGIVDSGVMLLPSVQGGSGPFPDRVSSWVGDAANLSPSQRFAAVSLYLAMMTATCLRLTGAGGPVIVEGPFAKNRIYGAMLAAATGREVFWGAGSATGTSLGAALLAAGGIKPRSEFVRAGTFGLDDRLEAYFAAWRRALA